MKILKLKEKKKERKKVPPLATPMDRQWWVIFHFTYFTFYIKILFLNKIINMM
jgi:hypothetical protein